MNFLVRQNKKVNLFEPLIISFFWILLFALPILIGQSNNRINWNMVFRVWKDQYIPLLLLFVVNRFVLLPFLFFRNKRVWYIISAVSLIAIISLGSWYYHPKVAAQREMVISHRVAPQPLPPRFEGKGFALPPRQRPLPPPIPPYVNLLILSVLMVGFDTGLKTSVRWAKTEQERIRLEKENVENQLAFLRNQVSPHFFMNTLNNIHALVDISSDKAKDAIITLSRMMRYLLYETGKGSTPLKKEVEFIESYVNLMKLRVSDKVKIDLELPENIPDKSIPPLLFTSFIENTFKHGVSYLEDSCIFIRLSLEEQNLILEVKNKKIAGNRPDEQSGIGIENSRKRLDLLYKSNYSLDIQDTEEFFIVKVTVPL